MLNLWLPGTPHKGIPGICMRRIGGQDRHAARQIGHLPFRLVPWACMPIPQRASILTRRQLSRPSVNSSMTGLFKNTPGKSLCSFQGSRANASRRPPQQPNAPWQSSQTVPLAAYRPPDRLCPFEKMKHGPFLVKICLAPDTASGQATHNFHLTKQDGMATSFSDIMKMNFNFIQSVRVKRRRP